MNSMRHATSFWVSRVIILPRRRSSFRMLENEVPGKAEWPSSKYIRSTGFHSQRLQKRHNGCILPDAWWPKWKSWHNTIGHQKRTAQIGGINATETTKVRQYVFVRLLCASGMLKRFRGHDHRHQY